MIVLFSRKSLKGELNYNQQGKVLLKVNGAIVAHEVRLIDEGGEQVGIVSLSDALKRADDLSMDLVEIDGAAKPAVCKILDYGKHKYKKNKKRHEARVKQKQVEVKEIKFRLSISRADYEVKLRSAERFLQEGNRVKAAIWFRGREIVKQELGQERLKQLSEDLKELADIEQAPNMEGRRLQTLLVPKKRKEKKNAKNENK